MDNANTLLIYSYDTSELIGKIVDIRSHIIKMPNIHSYKDEKSIQSVLSSIELQIYNEINMVLSQKNKQFPWDDDLLIESYPIAMLLYYLDIDIKNLRYMLQNISQCYIKDKTSTPISNINYFIGTYGNIMYYTSYFDSEEVKDFIECEYPGYKIGYRIVTKSGEYYPIYIIKLSKDRRIKN